MSKSLLQLIRQINITALLRSLAIYIAIIVIFIWWQHRDMLETGSTVGSSEIKLLDSNGQVFHYSFVNNQRDTLVYFFAPWCNICHASIDNIEELKQSYPENLNLIVIALDWKSVAEVTDFLAQHHLTSPVLLGTPQVADEYQISAFPSYYLISKTGQILARNKGYSSEIGMKLSLAINR